MHLEGTMLLSIQCCNEPDFLLDIRRHKNWWLNWIFNLLWSLAMPGKVVDHVSGRFPREVQFRHTVAQVCPYESVWVRGHLAAESRLSGRKSLR